jgi:hypothetical protein
MKSKSKNTQKKIERDYHIIMKGFMNQNAFTSQSSHLTSPKDIIPKFSLYQETPNSKASSDTIVSSDYQ